MRLKLRKQLSPINQTLQQIMATAEEMERKFAASFLEGEDYPREGDSSELARAKAELAILQNKFESMGFVSGPITSLEQITPKRTAPSVMTGMPILVMTTPPPPVENPARSDESAVILELTKTLINLIQESKKEKREHNVRIQSMMRSMRPIVSAHAPTLSFCIKPLNVLILNEDKWNDWWGAYLEFSFCLVEVIFHWSGPTPGGEGTKVPKDEVELLIVQAWRTETEGELLGIVFGKVEEGNLTLITSEPGEPCDRPRRSEEEEEAEVQRQREMAERKRPIEEGPPPELLLGDPSLNPESPREEPEDDGAVNKGSGVNRRLHPFPYPPYPSPS
ncbi:hypothetical protein CBR_g21274 [Chara braunii]|uniref:Uncharacterized protein n=1 Tax=Chara braunii TaxID=69332 RepID=A0A388L132_CHABU|nr:hypothetical protein CBR_g21274 [Chara braunii]|eukprot:GBG76034.1 hypothetical protein CBR_g21274 [Chara braunii]